MHLIFSFSLRDYLDPRAQQPNLTPTLFLTILAVVLEPQQRTVEEMPSVNGIQSMPL